MKQKFGIHAIANRNIEIKHFTILWFFGRMESDGNFTKQKAHTEK